MTPSATGPATAARPDPAAPPDGAPAAGRVLDHPDTADIRLEEVLHALADPMRLTVVRELAAARCEVACSEVPLPVSKSTTTHHFRVLREAGVICQVYRGTSKMNALRRADLDALFPGLLDRVLAAADAQESRLAGT
ncbi:ArsR/SmtB family transcription factor [Actinacidiphila acidipaludis]|uniref:Helix-turn-helix domain-containing protein n=1 Tax=Actinacidiphila acidipaludis TaxID=2873382 RepID=A0ABS7QIK0_9ACTN|nr:helix-turn-helix domain-containing protein [Streptomyces acidipaludis]MBY8883001.1 helix-turn-helix domain-containing protein [Streptomyces acidipaludis]